MTKKEQNDKYDDYVIINEDIINREASKEKKIVYETDNVSEVDPLENIEETINGLDHAVGNNNHSDIIILDEEDIKQENLSQEDIFKEISKEVIEDIEKREKEEAKESEKVDINIEELFTDVIEEKKGDTDTDTLEKILKDTKIKLENEIKKIDKTIKDNKLQIQTIHDKIKKFEYRLSLLIKENDKKDLEKEKILDLIEKIIL